MNIKEKNQAVTSILKALAIQLIPFIIFGLVSDKEIVSEDSLLYGVLAFIVFGLLIYGYFLLIKACGSYISSKGYSRNFGWLGLLSFVGIFILSAMPLRDNIISSEEQTDNNPFNYINLIEIFVFYLFGSSITLMLSGVILIGWDTTGFDKIDNPPEYLIFMIGMLIGFILTLRDLKLAGFKIDDFIPNFQVSWNLVAKIAVIYTIFWISFNRLIYYYLSFIFPDYTENLLNDGISNNFGEYLLLLPIRIIVYSIFSGLLYGLLLQKLSIKWGNKKGILIFCFIFSSIGLINLDPTSISVFVEFILISTLFFKTANLLNCIAYNMICIILSNIIAFIFYGFSFSPISVLEYQQKHQPFLVLYFILAIICFVLIVNFIRKNFPQANDQIPYYRNRNKLLNS